MTISFVCKRKSNFYVNRNTYIFIELRSLIFWDMASCHWIMGAILRRAYWSQNVGEITTQGWSTISQKKRDFNCTTLKA
jgi:hypothetical protein